MSLSYRELALVKARVLVHDPLNKSFLIKSLRNEFGNKHKEEALQFLQSLFEGTTLGGLGLEQRLKAVVIEADRIASAFDRWVLRLGVWQSGRYVYYDRLHNVFDPAVSISLGSPPGDGEVDSVAKKLNKILKNVDLFTSSAQEKELLLYNTLYTMLESTWYEHGLSPSLADTRTPTHTVFDHLYASAIISNMLLDRALNAESPDKKFSGFYVVIDFPGIQRFVNAGRKAGDIWASSWLLSNVAWGLAERFMGMYGYDVLVSPSPRINPYTLRTLASRLISFDNQENKLIEYELVTDLGSIVNGIREEKLRNAVNSILDVYAKLYEVSREDVYTLWLQPLIPATITLVLPKVKISDAPYLGTEDELVNEISKAFERSWNTIIDFVESRLSSVGDLLYTALGNVIKKLKDTLKIPPQGLSIAVVRIEDVYRALVECIVNKDKDACRDLGLNVNFKSLYEMLKGEELELLAESLLWHILLTRSTTLARMDSYGRLFNPIPRPFWTFSGNSLKSIDEKFERFSSGWIPCSICGYEPAYIVLRKGVKEPREVSFKDEDFGEFLTIADIQPQEHEMKVLQYSLTHIFKPGEALGPYCLLKRAIYFSFRNKLEMLSTDDVALSAISTLLNNTNLLKILREDNLKNIGLLKESLEYLFTPSSAFAKKRKEPFKDIYTLASHLGLNYEYMVNKISEILVDSCREGYRSGIIKVEDLLNAIAQILGIQDSSIYNLVLHYVENRKIDVNSVCSFLGLRTRYAIARGDADDIGKVMSGQKFVDITKYREYIIESIKRYGEVVGGNDVFQYLDQGYRNTEKLVEVLGLGSLPMTPAVHQSISLSLVLTALSDYKIVRSGEGVLIYSGGDDVTALLPVERAVDTVLKLRKEFYSNGFKKLRNIPVVSAIPTGRSFSVRIADIMDVMSTEMINAMELLENGSKRAKWVYRKENEGTIMKAEKDTLVISSSRSGLKALIPLEMGGISALEILRVKEVPLLLLMIVSRNLPEDYHKFVGDYENHIEPKDLFRIFMYVLERNIRLPGSESRENVVSELRRALETLANLSLTVENEERRALREYVSFIAISRDWV